MSDARLAQEFALPFLGGGEIHLEDPERRERIAISEGVEAGSQHDVLPYPVRDGVGQPVLCVAAAGGHEGAKIARHFLHGAIEVARKAITNQTDGNGIVQNGGRVGQLVRGAANGHAKGGFAGAAGLHGVKSTVARGPGG